VLSDARRCGHLYALASSTWCSVPWASAAT